MNSGSEIESYYEDLMVITDDNPNDLYRRLLRNVRICGKPRYTRETTSFEISPMMITLTNPLANRIALRSRKLNYTFRSAEFIYNLAGLNDAEWIGRYCPKIKEFADQDEGRHFFGAYGPRISERMPHVLKTLWNDRWSRQAVVTLWQNDPPKTKDVPCTVSLHFLVDHMSRLNLIVYMRSNDLWLGFPYDLYNFTMMQNWVAGQLNCSLGVYRHLAGSLHLYEGDVERARQLGEADGATDHGPMSLRLEETPTLSDALDMESFLRTETDRLKVEDAFKKIDPGWKQVLTPIKTFWEKKRAIN